MVHPPKNRCSMTFEKACHAKYLVEVAGLSQTEAAILLKLNVGQISHVINGTRQKSAYPVPPEDHQPT